MIKTLSIIAPLLLCSPLSALADARYGFGGSLWVNTVDDPNGPTDTDTNLSLSGFLTQPIGHNLRLFYEGRYHAFTLTPSQKNIGQNVVSYAFDMHLHRGFDFPGFKAWLGGGFNLGLNHYKGRKTLDQDGYIDQRFPNRDETNLGLLLTTGLSFETEQYLVFGASLTQQVSLNEGINGLSFNLFMLY